MKTLSELPMDINGCAKTPAADHLFNTKDKTKKTAQ